MLSLVIVLYVIGVAFAILKWRKHKVCKLILGSAILILPNLIVAWIAMNVVVHKNDIGYYKQQIADLTVANEQWEKYLEIARSKLSNDPEVLNYVEECISKEINYNNKQISECIGLQNTTYRWWIYFE